MGGRFGKYGDVKRLKTLQRSRREKSKLEKADAIARRTRSGLLPGVQKSSSSVSVKTYKTALVVIPPEHLWGPIQGLRKQYDRHFRRWMPHITLIYPFRPVSAFDQIRKPLASACRLMEPFEVRLNRFDFFVHSRRNSSLYLVPEPVPAFRKLHELLLGVVPDCDDTARFAGGFVPHLSVGQVRSREADTFRARWQAVWQSLVFMVEHVDVIWRNDPPDDVFRSGSVLPLGGE